MKSAVIKIGTFTCALLALAVPYCFAGTTQSAYERGLAAAEENRYAQAIIEFSKAIHENSKDDDSYVQRARCNNFLKKYPAVIEDCTQAIKLNPKNGRAYEYRGFAYLNSGQFEKGGADCRLALLNEKADEFDVLTPGLFDNYSKLLKMSGRMDESEKYFKRARALDMIRFAKEARETKQMDRAMKLVDKSIAMSPNETSAFLVRGIFNSNTNEYQKAVKDLSTAIDLDPKLIPGYYYRADAYNQLGQLSRAVEDYSTLISLKPRLVAFRLVTETGRLREHFFGTDDHVVNLEDIYYLRGRAQESLGHKKEALKDYEAASHLDPQDSEPLSRKAELLSKNGQTSLALKSLSTSVKTDESDWQTLASRARVYEGQKDYKKAMADYNRIIALNPKQPGAYFLRGQLAMKMGDFAPAQKDYSQMILLNPDLEDAYRCRAECNFRLGQFRKVVDDCSEGLKRDADNTALYALRAKAYEWLGKKDLAAKDRSRATAKLPPASVH